MTASPVAVPPPVAESRKPATARQQQVLDFIVSYTAARGYAPTLREIGRQFGIRSTNGVNDHLVALERKGLIRRSSMLSRTCVPVHAPPEQDSFANAVDGWKAENVALMSLLRKVQIASARLPQLTPEFVVLLGDIRDVVASTKGRADR